MSIIDNTIKYFISDRISSYTLDFTVAHAFSGGNYIIAGKRNCVYRTAIMPFSRVLYVAPLANCEEYEIISPTDSIFVYKNQLKKSYNNITIENGLFSKDDNSFDSTDNILLRTPQPDGFDIPNHKIIEIINKNIQLALTKDDETDIVTSLFGLGEIMRANYST
jgi:hypothetical protein